MTSNPPRPTPAWLLCLMCAYGAILAALTALNWFGADRWWVGALNLYMPQVLWLAPGVLLTLFSSTIARQWIWLPILYVLWVLGPIMGFCWPLHGPQQPVASIPVRCMTWNIKNGRHGTAALLSEIAYDKPDVILLQEASGVLDGPLGEYFREWNVRSDGQFVVASRFPLSGAEVRRISLPKDELTCLRCQLHIGTKVITLFNVHFQSPREGLNAFRKARRQPWYLPNAIQKLENNAAARLTQAQTLGQFLRAEQGPVIVAGDLNSADASLACATFRDAGLHDAFAEAGKGYGYTYGHFLLQRRIPWMRASWMRIDHIMVSSEIHTRKCWPGTGEASEHRPVIADLVLHQDPPPAR